MDVITTTGLTAASALLGAEVVERKGAGHPDTLADGVAEAISRAYSRYCLDQFGAILHHNTDKTSLLGGAADVSFGHGELTAPIQVLVNGRITAALGDHTIPVADIVTTAARGYLASALPLLDVERRVEVRPRLTQASSPGADSAERAVAVLVGVLSQVRMNVLSLVDGNLAASLRRPQKWGLLVAWAGENG
ncbi:S-adenosylmethionine synthetase [Streptomyces sp. SAI-126]|uniref:methionine adenosyltransferase n=1 Tax=unclassified Streptomyces TaxID=2593676 RepID=UPI0036E73683